MRILLTDPALPLAALVLENLRAADGVEPAVATADPELAARLKADGVPASVLDFEAPQTVVDALAGADRLFFALPLSETMTRRGHLLAEAAKAAQPDHVVLASHQGADIDAHFRLGKVYGGVDQGVIDSGLPYTIIRPNCFMQDFLAEPFAGMIRAGELRLAGMNAAVSFIDQRDAAQACTAVLLDPESHAGRAYALSGPAALSPAQCAGIIGQAAGKEIALAELDIPEAAREMAARGVDDWMVRTLVSVPKYAMARGLATVTGAAEFLAGRPPRDFASFAAEFARNWA